MKSVAKLHFIITAGGTREYIDPVRFITNASSGKMGLALAEAAQKAGHKVTLITTIQAQSVIPAKAGIQKIIFVETADEMFKAVKKCFRQCDCLIMAAAVSDYTPAKVSKNKLKKTNKNLTIRLKPTVDILKWAGNNKKKNQIIVGFALEDRNLKTNAEKKLKQKNLDMIIANAPSAIGEKKSTAYIKRINKGWILLKNSNKTDIAKKIIKLTMPD